MIYRRVLRYYRPFLGSTLAGLVFSLIGIGVNLLKPWPFKVIVDQILPHELRLPGDPCQLAQLHSCRSASPSSVSSCCGD